MADEWARKMRLRKNKSRVEEGDRKKKISPTKGLENDTIVKRRDESDACSAQYQHNTVERKAPNWLPLRLWT